MFRQDDSDTHLDGTLHDRVKIVNFEPQQDAVSVGFAVPICYRTVMMLHIEAV